MKREERPPPEYLDTLARRYGRIRFRTVDLDLRRTKASPLSRDDWGSVVLVAVVAGETIALVRHGEDPPGFFNFPMAPLGPGGSMEAVATAIGERELGLRVQIYKIPAVHVVRFMFDAGEIYRWHLIPVARVEGKVLDATLEPGTEVTYSANPMSLPRWRESDWHYWILRDAELAI